VADFPVRRNDEHAFGSPAKAARIPFYARTEVQEVEADPLLSV